VNPAQGDENMANLVKDQAKICQVAGGLLVHQNKALLVKHKKLGIWLCPGGHIDEGELPHQAAEREFWEETGVRVRATSSDFNYQSKQSQYLPTPLLTNLHWISRENYERRLQSSDLTKRVPSKTWPKGCEQHLGNFYLMEPVSTVKFKQNVEETDGIGWFAETELDSLETIEDIRHEVRYGLRVALRLSGV
jgi:8-oxo-dGTP pyrophosphatase MutT (NUDIX family)